jgi:hypothetical protein
VSYSSLNQQNDDPSLQGRVTAATEKEAWNNPTLKDTEFGTAVRLGSVYIPGVMMWPVCVATEAAYEYALNTDPPNPDPGGDPTVITDADILAAVQFVWPPDPWPPVSTPPTAA